MDALRGGGKFLLCALICGGATVSSGADGATYVVGPGQDVEEMEDGREFVVSLQENLVTLAADAPKRGLLRGISEPGWRVEVTVVNGGIQPVTLGLEDISVTEVSGRGRKGLAVLSEEEALESSRKRKRLLDGAMIVGSSVVGAGVLNELDAGRVVAAHEVLDTLGEVVSAGLEVSSEKARALAAQYENTMLKPTVVTDGGHAGGYVLVKKPSRRATGVEVTVEVGKEVHAFIVDFSK